MLQHADLKRGKGVSEAPARAGGPPGVSGGWEISEREFFPDVSRVRCSIDVAACVKFSQ